MSETSPRNPLVDLLRGLSILVVMLLHFTLTYRLSDSVFADVLGKPVVRALLINGNYGVTIFFVISGYLITTTSIDRSGDLSRVQIARFYAFRFARIFPCLVLALAIIVPLGLLGVPSFANRAQGQALPPSFFFTVVLSVLTFWHNVLMQWRGYFNYAINIYWSLSVEEVFYLSFPLLCVLVRRRLGLLLVWGAAVALGPVYRSLHTDDEILFMYAYPACFDAIALGCITAVLRKERRLRDPWAALLQLGGAALVVVTYLRGIDGNEVFGFTLVALGTAVLIGARPDKRAVPAFLQERPRLARAASLPARALAPVRWLGRHSYELYLFHIVVLGILRDLLPAKEMPVPRKPLWLLVYLLLSALVAALIARAVSEPANRRLRAALTRRRGS